MLLDALPAIPAFHSPAASGSGRGCAVFPRHWAGCRKWPGTAPCAGALRIRRSRCRSPWRRCRRYRHFRVRPAGAWAHRLSAWVRARHFSGPAWARASGPRALRTAPAVRPGGARRRLHLRWAACCRSRPGSALRPAQRQPQPQKRGDANERRGGDTHSQGLVFAAGSIAGVWLRAALLLLPFAPNPRARIRNFPARSRFAETGAVRGGWWRRHSGGTG